MLFRSLHKSVYIQALPRPVVQMIRSIVDPDIQLVDVLYDSEELAPSLIQLAYCSSDAVVAVRAERQPRRHEDQQQENQGDKDKDAWGLTILAGAPRKSTSSPILVPAQVTSWRVTYPK